jgi:hypothetical protein
VVEIGDGRFAEAEELFKQALSLDPPILRATVRTAGKERRRASTICPSRSDSASEVPGSVTVLMVRVPSLHSVGMTSWQNAAVESPRPLQIAVTALTMPASAQPSVDGGVTLSR